MSQRDGRVPQFGKWADGSNAAYTMIFESARKDKNSDPKLVNPNDPEATAAAAAAASKVDRPPLPTAARAPRFIINPNDPGQNPQGFRAGAAAFAQEYSHVKQEYNDRTPPRGAAAAAYLQQPAKFAAAGYGMEQQPYKRGRNSNSARSNNSDYTDGSHLGQRQGTAGRRPPESAAGAAHGIAASSPLRPQGTPGRRRSAVPKFGAWDETDPATSEGYTMVFKKVKEERQMAQAFPSPLLHDEPEPYHGRPSGYKPRESFWTKSVCTLKWPAFDLDGANGVMLQFTLRQLLFGAT